MSKVRWVNIASAIALLAISLCIANSPVLAQSQASTGQIVGTVKDAQGAAIANATVAVTNSAIGLTQTFTTNSDGIFRAVLLPVGDYSIKVTASGFGEFTQTGYRVEVGSTLDANIVVQVNAVNEVVTITAASVETTAVQTSATINSTAISELPINGRRFQDFVLLTPTADVDPVRNNLTLTGQRGINTNIQIDGADYSNPFFGGIRGGERASFAPTFPQEAVREFQVVASGYNAEFGRSTGGFVNAVTKSGSNDWRGSGFYLSRPKDMAARNALGQVSSPTLNQFGGAIGGPIIENRFFFFLAGEQQYFKQTRTVLFPNLATYDPNAAANTGTAGAFGYYKGLEGPYEQTNNGTTILGRLDFVLSDKHQANVRYNWSYNNAQNAVTAGTSLDPTTNSALSNNGTEGDRQNTAVAQVTSAFTPSLYNEFRFQFSREDRPRLANTLSPLVDNTIGSFGTVSFLPTTQYDTRYQISDNITLNRGAHSFKVGVDYNRTFANQFFAQRSVGNFSFAGIGAGAADITRLLRILTPGAAGGAADPANLFDDTAVRYRRNVGNGLAEMTSHEIALYGQDSWKILPNFTLSLGLRWEAQFMPQPDVSNSALTNIIRNSKLPLIGLQGVDPGVIPDQTDQFAPRLGIAYDPFKDGKTVVRAGAGIFYARTPLLTLAGPLNNFRTPPGDVTLDIQGFTDTRDAAGNITRTACANNIPAADPRCPSTMYKMFQLVGVNLNNFSLDNLPILTADQAVQMNLAVAAARGLTVNPVNGLQVISVGDGLKNPRSFQLNFGVEREMARGLTLGFTLDYVNTVHLNRNRDFDLPVPVVRQGDLSLRPYFGTANGNPLTTNTGARVTPTRPITELGNNGYLQIREPSARATYKALVLRAQYRNKWVQFDTFYTLSKNMDDDSTERNASFAQYDNSYNLQPEYNFSAADRRHAFTYNAVFNLPVGFQLSTLGRFTSGQPIDVTVSSIVAPAGSGLTGAQYANLVTLNGTNTTGDLNQDAGNFNDRPYLAPGVSLKRNAYRNFGNRNIDVRLQRDFKIGERLRISPSFEVFNLLRFKNFRLNGTTILNYGNPGINERTGESLGPTNQLFLQLRNPNGTLNVNNLAGVPRAMQVGVRVNF